MNLRTLIRTIPDFPTPGVAFRDISPLLASPDGFTAAIEAMAAPFRDHGITAVAALDARGFLFAPSIANQLRAGLVMIRKSGKLPGATYRQEYALEYGTASIEIQRDALTAHDRVLLVDDVIATGGTLAAAATLIRHTGATVVGYSALIGLPALGDYTTPLLAAAPAAVIHTVVEYA